MFWKPATPNATLREYFTVIFPAALLPGGSAGAGFSVISPLVVMNEIWAAPFGVGKLMSDDSVFLEMIRRAQLGDELASEELVKTYLPQVRRYVRVKITGRALRRQMDSLDVCQSVFGNFFFQLGLGNLEVQSPGHLVQLLATMARNRLINHVNKQNAAKRDERRLQPLPVEEHFVVDAKTSVSQAAIAKETLEQALSRMTADERRIHEKLMTGFQWDEIAKGEGKSTEAVRKQYTRAIDRICRSFQHDGDA
jgi:RNA polymerase sigma factor (sigma-70 family)